MGVISDPEIFRYEKDQNGYLDAFVIIGSDGLWDFVSNEKCVEIVWEEFEKYLKNSDLDPETAVEALVKLASA